MKDVWTSICNVTPLFRQKVCVVITVHQLILLAVLDDLHAGVLQHDDETFFVLALIKPADGLDCRLFLLEFKGAGEEARIRCQCREQGRSGKA